ncbi:MAG: aldo/keto reductase [Lachnospiraceae bacterium]|nr:aldo/keto reductase [Lachnospiraceae bacterium]
MLTVTLGKTGIRVPKNGFGALPIQRVTVEYAGMLLKKAYENGIRYFDTARAYSDSEKKIGLALADARKDIYIATKTQAKTAEAFWKDLETSLELLKTDYIDVYQFHNPPFCPKPGDGTGLYEAALEAKAQGRIRHIGITNHRLRVAEEAIESGLYETLQFPFSYLATEKDLHLVELCREHDMGFIAMKGLAGGLLNQADLCYAFMCGYDNVLPIWGVQREKELDEFLNFAVTPPEMNGDRRARIEKDRKELLGNFCRGCGYCMPCAVGIEINNCARMIQMIRRSPTERWLTSEWQEKMLRIEDCIRCGKCKSRCPYGLDTPQLLYENLIDYKKILSGEIKL